LPLVVTGEEHGRFRPSLSLDCPVLPPLSREYAFLQVQVLLFFFVTRGPADHLAPPPSTPGVGRQPGGPPQLSPFGISSLNLLTLGRPRVATYTEPCPKPCVPPLFFPSRALFPSPEKNGPNLSQEPIPCCLCRAAPPPPDVQPGLSLTKSEMGLFFFPRSRPKQDYPNARVQVLIFHRGMPHCNSPAQFPRPRDPCGPLVFWARTGPLPKKFRPELSSKPSPVLKTLLKIPLVFLFCH